MAGVDTPVSPLGLLADFIHPGLVRKGGGNVARLHAAAAFAQKEGRKKFPWL